MDVFNTKNAVIMAFLPFAGGKFLGNCLSLSKDFCLQDPLAAEYLLQNPTDYDYRLEIDKFLKHNNHPNNKEHEVLYWHIQQHLNRHR